MTRLYKKFGQVMLNNTDVLTKIVSYAHINDEIILEIGPGSGNLTHYLLQHAAKVIAIESSARFINILKHRFSNFIATEQLLLIHGNALKTDFPPFDKIVSNIPYYITSPLLFKLFQYNFKKAIMLVQKEFALRLVAPVNTNAYSRLTVSASYYGQVKILEYVKKTAFNPVPKVDSAIIEIIPKKQLHVLDPTVFFDIVKLLFSHRRKMIKNIIALPDVPFSDKRVESLTPEEIAIIANFVKTKQKSI